MHSRILLFGFLIFSFVSYSQELGFNMVDIMLGEERIKTHMSKDISFKLHNDSITFSLDIGRIIPLKVLSKRSEEIKGIECEVYSCIDILDNFIGVIIFGDSRYMAMVLTDSGRNFIFYKSGNSFNNKKI